MPPRFITKELASQFSPARNQTVIRASSNLLREHGFHPGVRIQKSTLPAGRPGIRIRICPMGEQQIYSRRYARTKEPEAQLEIAHSQWTARLLGAQRFQLVSQPGQIDITPIPDRRFQIISRNQNRPELEFFSVLSSGICAHAFLEAGFTPQGICEWRPPEKRDVAANRDLTETGMLTALKNVPFPILFNQDIFSLNNQLLHKTMGRKKPTLIAGSLQCDSFSTLKSARLKERVRESGEPGDAELFYPLIKLVESLEPAVIFLENVPAFFTSEIGGATKAILRRLGYFTKTEILNGTDFGTRCHRRRGFLVASVWPNYEFPKPQKNREQTPLTQWLGEHLLATCQDVTNSPLISRAQKKGRIRCLPEDKPWAPTFTKSQNRTDDRVLLEYNGRILNPSLAVMQKIHGIPSGFEFPNIPKEIKVEQIGQGVDYPLLLLLAQSLWRHTTTNLGRLL